MKTKENKNKSSLSSKLLILFFILLIITVMLAYFFGNKWGLTPSGTGFFLFLFSLCSLSFLSWFVSLLYERYSYFKKKNKKSGSGTGTGY
jgi:hypothetical protein